MLTSSQISELADCVGEANLLTDPADRWPYGYDNSRQHALPDAVVYGTSHDQIAALVAWCNRHQVPITARGRGTGTTGGSVPLHGGIVLSLERMDRIRRVDPENRVMVVEPGATNQAVQEAAKAHGFFWPPDPTSAGYCTIGGNLAFNAAGPRAVKYGTCRENTLRLRAITGKGETIHTGVYTTKGVVGYDLTRLLIGSEGTLAIVTEATLKLTPTPEELRTIRAVYRDVGSAAEAVSRIMRRPTIPYALEFIDGAAIEMIRAYSQADLPREAGAMLMIEVEGTHSCVKDAVESVRSAALGDGTIEVQAAETLAEADALWATRKALSPALRNVAPKKINEDVVVPVSAIPELVNGLSTLAEEFGIKIVNFGHAGNGNIHVNLLVDPNDEQQLEAAAECLDRVFALVLRLEGTLSGEHGVGVEKRDFIDREIDAATLDVMRRIKQQFDPVGILNPDKGFPAAS